MRIWRKLLYFFFLSIAHFFSFFLACAQFVPISHFALWLHLCVRWRIQMSVFLFNLLLSLREINKEDALLLTVYALPAFDSFKNSICNLNMNHNFFPFLFLLVSVPAFAISTFLVHDGYFCCYCATFILVGASTFALLLVVVVVFLNYVRSCLCKIKMNKRNDDDDDDDKKKLCKKWTTIFKSSVFRLAGNGLYSRFKQKWIISKQNGKLQLKRVLGLNCDIFRIFCTACVTPLPSMHITKNLSLLYAETVEIISFFLSLIFFFFFLLIGCVSLTKHSFILDKRLTVINHTA